VSHPFWQAPIAPLPLPPEPALEAYFRRHNLLPPPPGAGPAPPGGAAADADAALAGSRAAARALRESVDVTRLSRIAMHNLEKVGGPGGGPAAGGGAGVGGAGRGGLQAAAAQPHRDGQPG
jgi:serine/threonine-protein kinase ULK4